METDITMASAAMATYKAARKAGLSRSQSCTETMRVHGIDAAQAADLCWRVETGKPAPVWTDASGHPLQAALDWSRGADRRHDDI